MQNAHLVFQLARPESEVDHESRKLVHTYGYLVHYLEVLVVNRLMFAGAID